MPGTLETGVSVIQMRKAINFCRDRHWWTVAAAAVLPGVLTAGIEYILTNGVSGQLPIFAAATGGIIAFVVLRAVTTPDTERPQSKVAATKDDISPSLSTEATPLPDVTRPLGNIADGKFFSPRTPDELVAEAMGKTEIVANELAQRHIGHWIKVEGEVKDVWESKYSVVIMLRLLDSDVMVSMAFDATGWRERLIALDVGDRVSGIGNIQRIASPPVAIIRLEDCELSSW